jgi:hypothetical protein
MNVCRSFQKFSKISLKNMFKDVKSAKNSLIEVFKTCNLKFLKENGVGKNKFRIIIDNVF